MAGVNYCFKAVVPNHFFSGLHFCNENLNMCQPILCDKKYNIKTER